MAQANIANQIFVAPNGADSAQGTRSAPFRTLARAQTAARKLKGSATVFLSGGTYVITQPLTLTSADSGRGGTVTWTALPGASPVISGGRVITGWAEGAHGVWSAPVPASLDTREFYVNGAPATRARSAASPAGFTASESGVQAPANVGAWRRLTDLEVVGFNEWKIFRCRVAQADASQLTMVQPCWSNAYKTETTFATVQWIENGLELLDQPGEWYLDRIAHRLYYKPRSGEVMRRAVAVVPVTQRLLKATNVSDVAFAGLTFQFAGWSAPNGDDGYVTSQTGIHRVDQSETMVPAAVSLVRSRRVTIRGCSFVDLAAAGVSLTDGTQRATVTDSRFRDLGAAAVIIGGVDNPNAPTSDQDRDVVIQRNIIQQIGRQYFDAPAVFAGYVANVTITHNDIGSIPYSGITVGWGWGRTSNARNNEISFNYIHDFTQVLQDAGAIYTLSPQPGSTVHDNYIMNGAGRYGCLYPDDGSAGITWNRNVCSRVFEWLHVWTPRIKDLKIVDNYTDVANHQQFGTNITFSENVTVVGGRWPTAARNIMAAAGTGNAPTR